MTALHHSAAAGDNSATQRLLDARALPTTRDWFSLSPSFACAPGASLPKRSWTTWKSESRFYAFAPSSVQWACRSRRDFDQRRGRPQCRAQCSKRFLFSILQVQGRPFRPFQHAWHCKASRTTQVQPPVLQRHCEWKCCRDLDLNSSRQDGLPFIWQRLKARSLTAFRRARVIVGMQLRSSSCPTQPSWGRPHRDSCLPSSMSRAGPYDCSRW